MSDSDYSDLNVELEFLANGIFPTYSVIHWEWRKKNLITHLWNFIQKQEKLESGASSPGAKQPTNQWTKSHIEVLARA